MEVIYNIHVHTYIYVRTYNTESVLCDVFVYLFGRAQAHVIRHRVSR